MPPKVRSPRLNTRALAKLRSSWNEDRSQLSRRSFVISSATALAAPAAAKATNVASILGGFKVHSQKGKNGALEKVTVEVDSDHVWTLDASILEGNPVLSLKKKGKALTVSLTNARFPGTQFKQNLVATIEPRITDHSIRIDFKDTGVQGSDFSLNGSLEKWILGGELSTPVKSGQAEAIFASDELANHTGVRIEGDCRLNYLATNGFQVEGRSVVTTPDAHYEVSNFVLQPNTRSMETLVGGRTKSSTTLEANRRGDWDHSVDVQSESGWRLTGDASGFDRLTSESHETGVTGLVLTGSGGLVAKLGDVSFPVEDSQIAQLYGTDSNVIASGKLKSDATWVHRPGLSAKLAPAEDSTMILSTDRSGSVVGEPLVEATQVVPKIDDAIVTVRSASESFPVSFQNPVQRVDQIKKPVIGATAPTLQAPGALEQHTSVIGLYINFFATLDIVRVSDMLNLSFEMVNLAISTTSTAIQITTGNSAAPSFIVVEFPSQSVAEETFPETTNPPAQGFEGLPGQNPTFAKTRLSNPSRLVFSIPRTAQIASTLEGTGGLLDWSNWSQMVAPTAISSYAPIAHITIDPGWINPVVLPSANLSSASEVLNSAPPSPKISFTRSLKRSAPISPVQPGAPAQASVTNIPISVIPTKTVKAVPTGRIPVTRYETWIEMPAWLCISPPETAVWIHSPAPTPNAPNPIWSTRLAYGTEKTALWTSDDGKWFYVPSPTGFSGPFSSPVELHPTIRAIDAFDYTTDDGEKDKFFSNPAMSPGQRSSIVRGMTPRSVRPEADTPPFIVENLTLTSLGGYLKGDWVYPNAPVQQGIVSWKHIATLGRDHYVRLTQRGFLYPFMHRAVLVQISERHFDKDEGTQNVFAVLRTRQFVMITQPTMSYSAEVARSLGFTHITCTTKQTQNLTNNANVGGQNIFWMETVNGQAYLSFRGVDFDGNTIHWEQECGFVDLATAVSNSTQSQILNLGDPPGGPSDLGGQMVTFAPVDKSTTNPQTTHFPTQNITFDGVGGGTDGKNTPNFRPTLKNASIRISGVEIMQTGGGSTPTGPVTVEYAPLYKQHGFGSGNPSEFLFVIPTKAPAQFGNLKSSGGLVNPDMPLGALSRKHGPLPSIPSDGQNIPVTDYLGSGDPNMGALAAKILGAVSIWDIIPNQINVGGDGKDAPKITVSKVYSTEKNGSGQDSSLQSAAGDVTNILGTGNPVSSQKEVIGLKAEFKWSPTISNFSPFGPPLFLAQGVSSIFAKEESTFASDMQASQSNPPPDNTTFTVDAWFEEIFTTGGSGDPSVGSHYSLKAELLYFRIVAIAGIFEVIDVDVQRVGIYASDGSNVQIKIDIPAITFTGCLSFVQTLENWLGGGSNDVHFPTPDSSSGGSSLVASIDGALQGGDTPGFTPIMQVSDGNIEVGGTLAIPDISVGYFSLSNISFTATVNLPFLGPSLSVSFSFCTQDNPFMLSVDGIAGGGFFAITLVPSGLQQIKASLEFGASISIDLGVASGGVSIMAGIYYEYDAPTNETTLTGFVKLEGNLTIIEIISMSLEFYLALTYTNANGVNSVTGTASMTVEVSILFFSVGVTVSVTKTFGGSSSDIGHSQYDGLAVSKDGALPLPPPTSAPFTQGMSQAQYGYYCGAFAGAN